MIVRWPGRVKPGETHALVSQVDLLASLSALTSQKIPAGQAPDSQNQLAALLGTDPTGRETLVEQKTGDLFGFREGNWKLLPNGGKKGGGAPTLYDLSNDLAERNDLAAKQPDRVAAMMARFKTVVGELPQSKKANRE